MTSTSTDAARLTQLLLDPSRRVTASAFPRPADQVDLPGLYAWFADERGATMLASGLGEPIQPGLIYGGQAGAGGSTATLLGRIRRNHLHGNVRGSTFRLTLASVLARELGLARQSRRLLLDDGESRLSAWMIDHLEVAVAAVPHRARLLLLEAEVLAVLDPPLNLRGMRPTNVRLALARIRGLTGDARSGSAE